MYNEATNKIPIGIITTPPFTAISQRLPGMFAVVLAACAALAESVKAVVCNKIDNSMYYGCFFIALFCIRLV